MSSDETPLTPLVADYVAGARLDRVPRAVVSEAKRCLVDGFAVMLAGSRAQCSQVIGAYLQELGEAGRCSVVGRARRVRASFAALANGVAGHADDYDDTQLATRPDRVYGLLTHPTVPVLAAALAVAEEAGASGADLLLAFVVGQEVECKIAEAIRPQHYTNGFHSTGTIGIFGATAAACRLRGLSAEECRHALGVAASKSAGLRVNFGTMTKPYHCGAAAENGVVAAQLASLGYRADPSALDGRWGFFQVTGGGCDPDLLAGRLGNPYSLLDPGVSVKPYPCGSLSHPSLDALRDLLLEHDIRPEQIKEVRLAAGNNILAPLRYTDPQNELEAKFSLQFVLAAMALERRAGLQQFTDETVHRPDVRAMMRRVKPYYDREIEARGSELMRSRVEVVLADGRTLTRDAEVSRGTPQRPMSKEEMEGKFRECAQGTITETQMKRALAVIETVEQQPDLKALAAALRPGRRPAKEAS
ncbi:MAG: MmgE/PrpD family protein [Chloroflexi bacterium]|nr:MmgE/PrpD family protein [Chloroflexota bacterium]